MAYAMSSKHPARKVKAASGGGGVGSALGTLVVFAIERGGVDLPGPVEASILVLVAAGCAFVAGYYARPGAADTVVAG